MDRTRKVSASREILVALSEQSDPETVDCRRIAAIVNARLDQMGSKKEVNAIRVRQSRWEIRSKLGTPLTKTKLLKHLRMMKTIPSFSPTPCNGDMFTVTVETIKLGQQFLKEVGGLDYAKRLLEIIG